MKKILSLILVLVLAAGILSGCSAPGGSDASVKDQAVDLDSLKTMADVLALDSQEQQTAFFDDIAVYVFQIGDTYYRAIARTPKDTSDALWALEYDDEQYEEKRDALLSPLPIEKLENLNEQILSQEELDALVGKTGQELWDAGWYNSGYNLEDMEFWMNYGPFLYAVTFDGHVDEADYDTFDEESVKDMKVTSARFMALGDGSNIEE